MICKRNKSEAGKITLPAFLFLTNFVPGDILKNLTFRKRV